MSRIVILTFTEVVSDPRVMRHVAALRGEHEVVTCGTGPAPAGVVGHLELPRVDHLPRTPAGLVGLALRQSKRAYARLPAANASRRALAGQPFDLVIANDITAVPVAVQVADGRPVIADLHEYAPSQFEDDWRWRLMVKPFNLALCRTWLPRAAAVTTVCEGIAAEYQRQFGIACHTITNASPYRAPQPRQVGPVIRAVHTGAAQPNRELQRTIAAAAEVPGLMLDLYLVASQANQRHLVELKRLAGDTTNVRVLDPVPMAAVPQTLDGYDIGVFLLPPTSFNSEHALPNKFFDFVQSGLGVVVGPSPEMARLVSRHGLGLVLPDFEVSSLRAALSRLDPATVSGWKAASCTAAEELSAEHQAQRLRSLVAEALRRDG